MKNLISQFIPKKMSEILTVITQNINLGNDIVSDMTN